jgi:hypothetical protein
MSIEIRPRNPHGFHHAAQFTEDHIHIVLKHPELEKIIGAFVRNMSRVRGIGMLPINLISVTVINEAARVEALYNLKIPFHDPRVTLGHRNYDPDLFAKLDTERKRLVDEWVKEGRTEEKNQFMIGAHTLNVIIDCNEQQSWEAVQATLAAMLMGLWTAFESITQDIWVAAVNAHPATLGQRVVKRSADLNLGSQIKSISWDSIIKVNFDLTNSLGRVLLFQRAVNFQQLESIRAAYKVTFKEEFEPIFSAHNDLLSELEAIRNLFTHKGGVIDERFASRVKHPPNMQVGGIYCVSGQYVAEVARGVSACSTAIITSVDNWLEQNQSKP